MLIPIKPLCRHVIYSANANVHNDYLIISPSLTLKFLLITRFILTFSSGHVSSLSTIQTYRNNVQCYEIIIVSIF